MKRILSILLLILLVIASTTAQDIRAVKGEVKNGYNFWLSTPSSVASEEAELVPLVVFLHGSSLCGNNLDRVMRYGTMAAVKGGLGLDAYVIAPQNPGGAWSPDRVMNCVDYVIDGNPGIDPSRIYVLGMSLGGYGTIDLAAAYPDRIAAAMAICGGGSMGDYQNLNQLPLWIIHGTADRAVSIAESDRVVSAMRSDDPDTPRLIYDRVPGMNHSQPARLFYMPAVYEWLFSHSLSDYDRYVSEGFPISLDMMKGAYRQRGAVSLTTLTPRDKRPIDYNFTVSR